MRLKHLLQGLSYPCTIEIGIRFNREEMPFYLGELENETRIKYTWTHINHIMNIYGECKVLGFWERNELDYNIEIEEIK